MDLQEPGTDTEKIEVNSGELEVGKTGSIGSPSKLRREIERIIDRMSCPEASSQVEESLVEVNIKEHTLENPKTHRRIEKVRQVKVSSDTDCKQESCSDSARTDVGIPPIPVCESPNEAEIRTKPAVVVDPLSKRKVYMPGRTKRDSSRCPHRRAYRVTRGLQLSLPSPDIPSSISSFSSKKVNRYHYNHYVLKNKEPTPSQNKEQIVVQSDLPMAEGSQLSLLQRMKLACSRLRHRDREVKGGLKDRDEVQVMDSEPLCYCGSGPGDGHQKSEDISSGESFSQLYKVRVDSTRHPTSFVFHAVDRQVTKHHGEVRFVVDNTSIAAEGIVDDLTQVPPQADLIQSPSPLPASPAPPPAVEQDLSRLKQVPSQRFEEEEEASYQPTRCRPQRIDIYMFDHQDSRYLQTTDNPPPVYTEATVNKVEHAATRFWAEVFSVVHVIFAFLTAFVLQTLKFVLLAIGRPLTTGIIQMISDYLLKPFLTIVFNGLVQPPLIFLYNVGTSFRDICRPLATGMGYFIREWAVLLASFRLCRVNCRTDNGPILARTLSSNV